ncbi:MAG: CopG family transcriptional regulator [Erysipelotrichaceae bacterium]|nr:CopG family transcriptional regulator [Erysipelotrichaceae bacterium]
MSETRIAVAAIIVEKKESVEALNTLLHEYGDYIIGRMGIPNTSKGVSVISVALDATNDEISALTGKIGNIEGISIKTIYSSL